MKDGLIQAISTFLVGSALLLAIFLLGGCSQQKVVTLTEYRDRVQMDTILRVDSIYRAHYIVQQGDTIRVTDTICQFRILHDTRDVLVRDSIPYAVEVVREVRRRNAYDRATSAGFWILLAVLVLLIYVISRKR